MEAAKSQDESKLHLNQAHLLTPESPLLDSFSPKVSVAHQQPQASVPSPPASPQFDQQFQKDYDQQLYPDNNTHNDTNLPPLFNQDGQSVWASRQRTPPAEKALSIATQPSPKHNPIASSQSTPSKRFVLPVGPAALLHHFGYEYYEFMLAQMEGHRAHRMRNRTLPEPKASHRDRDTYDKTVLRSLGSYRVDKARPTVRPATRGKPVRPTSSRGEQTGRSPVLGEVPALPVKHVHSPPRRPIRNAATPEAVGNAASKRTRAAPTKKLDGKIPSQWAELEDFSPPIESLDNAGTELSVVWNNASALNLDSDVDRVHLHPQELKIASKLRLHCNEYLLNKRRIFAAKVRSLQENTVFNKTSAQNATSVDVNKASRLWSAFDGAGWFEPAYFEQWL